MKHDCKRDEKALYATSKKPMAITVPMQKFIMIDGRGDPNKQDFAERVGVLYSLAYGIKMDHKRFCEAHPERAQDFAYQDYTVFPLEGVWSSESTDPSEKDKYIYTIMIRQPDFITDDTARRIMASVAQKKPHPLLSEARFGEMEDGLCIQMLHNGPFDDEPATFAAMDAFAKEHGYARVAHTHREIYLSDTRKTPPEKRKTILRYQARKI